MCKNIYTDLALETAETIQESGGKGNEGNEGNEIEGIRMDVSEHEISGGSAKTTWIEILNEAGAEALGRPAGNYITVESEAMKSNDIEAHEGIIKILADLLGGLEKLRSSKSVLIAGLGNRNVTPDALGPRVASKTLVTRHIKDAIPEELKNIRSAAVVSPGVMGTTGIETSEIIKGVAEHIKPDIIIVIDALAARRASRVNTTIQIADTGLIPGSGMGNTRKAITKETMGVPVVAIGVPTVYILQVK